MKRELIEMLRTVDDEDLQIRVQDDIIRDEKIIEIRVSNYGLSKIVSRETRLAKLAKAIRDMEKER